MNEAHDICGFCGNFHGKICPSVRAIEYHENGTIKRVEFMRPVDLCHPPQPMVTTTAWPPNSHGPYGISPHA